MVQTDTRPLDQRSLIYLDSPPNKFWLDLPHLVSELEVNPKTITIDNINYLNLELSDQQKTLIKIKNNSLVCNFNTSYNHELHGENSQLNNLIDLIINLGENLNYYQTKLNLLLEKNLNSRQERFEEIKTIILNKNPKTKNLDYIKDQNSIILEKLSKLNLEKIEEE